MGLKGFYKDVDGHGRNGGGFTIRDYKDVYMDYPEDSTLNPKLQS